jgi:uncharacterized membrane protein YgcG
MKHFAVLALIIAGMAVKAHSQSIKGKLLDLVDNKPLASATLTLTSIRDSTQVKFGLTDSTGAFVFQNLPIDSFYFKISYTGYEQYRQIVATNDSTPVVNIGTLFIPKTTTTLDDVTVTSRTPPTQQKGDTIQFNASQFKVNPDATVEDLVKKAPGITVERDGTVTAQGEQVRKVTIDGRDFFGDDASAALRNLPADIVDKIQVFDRLSDQAQLTGVDDGNSLRAINIVTKAGMKNGQFGRIYAGYGTDERYSAGGNVSFFKENRRISLVGTANNINQQNFASQDLLGVTSSGGGRGGFGGGGNGGRGGRGGGNVGGGGNFGGGGGQNFTVGQQSGISRTNAIGINYSDKWGQKLDVSGSYFFNNSNVNNDQLTRTATTLSSGVMQIVDENSVSRRNNYNHRFNLRMEYRIDSNNTVIITPNLSFQKNKSMSSTFTQSRYDTADLLVTEILNNLNSVNSGYNFNNNILYRHAFAKRGRSISVNLTTSFNQRDGESYQDYFSTDFKPTPPKDSTSLQFFDNTSSGKTISANIIYTEPVGKKGQLQFNYNPSFTKNKSNRENFGYDETTKTYSDFDSDLSNKFDNTYNTQNGGITYRIGDRDNQFSAGVNYQHSALESEQVFPQAIHIERTFSNILPNLQLRRKLSARSSIRLFYRSSVNAPSISQLQNVIDPTSGFFISTGNPDLDQSFTHQLSARYTFTNTSLGQSFFANVFVQKVNDYIANGIYTVEQDSVLTPKVTLRPGGQLSKPVNLDGYWSFRSFLTFGQPIKALKVNINLNAGFNFSRTPGASNDIVTMTNTYTYSTGVVVASNVSEYVDFNLSYSANFNRIRSEIETQNSNYFNHSAGIQFNLLSKKGWFLQNDLSNQFYTGLSQGLNQSFWLWNAAIGKKLLKNRQGELKLSVFDLLKQNQSISRTVDANRTIDERNTVLQQYFMLTFTYNLKNFGTPASRRGGGGSGGGQRRPNPDF